MSNFKLVPPLLQGGDEISPTRLCNFGGGEEISPTLLWNFEGGGEISPTLLSKLEGGEEISPQGEFPPRVPSWPRKSGARPIFFWPLLL